MIKIYGEWILEITEAVMRKTKSYGLPYSGIVTLKIINRELIVTGLLLVNGKPNKRDLKALNDAAKDLGFDTFTYKNGDELREAGKHGTS
jgi:hypothetical protein